MSGLSGGRSTSLRFPGQWEDEESGLSYNLNRYYDAETGQYLSVDPIGLEGDVRTQGYVANPTSWIDAFGLVPCSRPETAAERSAKFQGTKPYQGVDPLRNIQLKAGKRIAHITFRSDGRPISEYFTTESAIARSRLPDGTIDANRLNQGLQIYGGKDANGVPRPNFKPYVQYLEVEQTIPHGQVGFGRTLANPHLNPGDYPALPQMFINNEYHSYLKPVTFEQMSNTATPAYDPGQIE